MKSTTLKILLILCVLVFGGLTLLTGSLRRSTRAKRAPASGTREERKTVPLVDSRWSEEMVEVARETGAGVIELNTRPEARSTATFTGDQDRLLATLEALEERGVPLKRVWLGPSPDSAGTPLRLLVELERPPLH